MNQLKSFETESTLGNINEEYLQIKNAYGIDLNSSHTLGFVNKTTFLYLVGCNLLTYDIETFKQKLISFKCKGRIEFVKISSNNKFALLVDIEQKTSNLILIDLAEGEKKRIQKRSKQIENETICSVCISNDMELIACQTTSPHWSLIIFSFTKFELLAKLKALGSQSSDCTIENVSFFPSDNKRLLLVGNKLIKIYLYTKKGLKLVYNLDCDFELVDHSWLNKSETVSFDKHGNLFLIEPKQNLIRTLKLNSSYSNETDQLNEYESKISLALTNTSASLFSSSKLDVSDLSDLKSNSKTVLKNTKAHEANNRSRIYSNSNLKHYNSSLSIKALQTTRRGFFLCYSNDDRVFYYDGAQKDINNYSLLFTIKLKKSEKYKQVDKSFKEVIVNMLVNESQTYLVVATNRKIVYYCDLNELFTLNNTLVDFELIIDNFHSESLTGMDYCVRKPLITTCSSDRWLIIWNYDTNSVEMRQNFDEDLFSVAFHPSGLYLILATTNSLKYMAIYLDSLKVIHVLNVRSCTNCIFSNGGHMFAFVHGTVIQVYSSVKYEEIGSIKAQDMGKIKQLRFSKDDHYLMSCSMAGIIRIWNSKTLAQICEIMTKGLSYIGIALHPNQEWIFLISTEKSIRQFQLPISDEYKSLIKLNSEAILLKRVETKSDENITCIEVSKSGKMVCIGTNKGWVRVYLLPMENYKEFRAHFGTINKLCLAYGDECLITASDDGSVIFWNIGNKLKDAYNEINQSNEEVLIDKEEYLNKSRVILNYEDKLKESRIETSFKLRMKELKFNVKKRELKHRFNSQIVEMKDKIESLRIEEDFKVQDFNEKFDLLIKTHLDQYESLHDLYKSKIEFENLKNLNLENKIEFLKCELKSNEIKLSETLKRNDLIVYENIENKLNLLKEKNLSKIDFYENKINDLIKFEYDFEDQIENEIGHENIDFEAKLHQLGCENDSIKSDLSKVRIEFKTQKNLIKDYLKNGYRPENDILDLKSKIKELEHLEVKLRSDIELKGSQIIQKENEFADLNKESDSFELTNSALESKISHLTNTELEPIKFENQQLNVEYEEIRAEIKQKVLELNKLRFDVSNYKTKVKFRKKFFKRN